MAEKMLITLDGSAFAEAALHYAENLVDRLMPQEKPEITLLMVLSPHVEYINVEGGTVPVVETPDLEKERQHALDYLEQAATPLRQKGINVNVKLVDGEISLSPADAIIEAEKEVGADLVVTSTHGRRGITRWAIGSVTDKVLHGGNVPVLMIRAKK